MNFKGKKKANNKYDNLPERLMIKQGFKNYDKLTEQLYLTSDDESGQIEEKKKILKEKKKKKKT